MVDGGGVNAQLDSAIAGLGVRVLSARWSGRTFHVRVERMDSSSPSLDEIALATPLISEALDSIALPGKDPYELEVSSPGLERELYLPEHYLWAVGQQVVATLDGDGSVSGTLVAATGEELVIEEMGRAVRKVPLPEVRSCHTRFEWGGSPKGRAQGRGRSQADGKG